MPNFMILEHCRHRPWLDEVQVVGPVVRDGHIELNERPGFDIELNWHYVKRHPYLRLPLRTFSDRDGVLPMV